MTHNDGRYVRFDIDNSLSTGLELSTYQLIPIAPTIQEYRFVCDKCGRAFQQGFNMRRHQWRNCVLRDGARKNLQISPANAPLITNKKPPMVGLVEQDRWNGTRWAAQKVTKETPNAKGVQRKRVRKSRAKVHLTRPASATQTAPTANRGGRRKVVAARDASSNPRADRVQSREAQKGKSARALRNNKRRRVERAGNVNVNATDDDDDNDGVKTNDDDDDDEDESEAEECSPNKVGGCVCSCGKEFSCYQGLSGHRGRMVQMGRNCQSSKQSNLAGSLPSGNSASTSDGRRPGAVAGAVPSKTPSTTPISVKGRSFPTFAPPLSPAPTSTHPTGKPTPFLSDSIIAIRDGMLDSEFTLGFRDNFAKLLMTRASANLGEHGQ